MGDTPDLTRLDGIFKSTKNEVDKLREITEFINKYIAECRVGMTEAQKAASQEEKRKEEERRRKAKIDDKDIKSRDGSGDEGSEDGLEEMLAQLIKLLTGILSTRGGGRKQRGGSVLKAKPINELMIKEGNIIKEELSKELANLKPKQGRDKLSKTLNDFINDGVLVKFTQIQARSIGFSGDDEIEMYTSDSEAAEKKRNGGLEATPKHDAKIIQEKILASTKLEPVLDALKDSVLINKIYVDGYKNTLTSILKIANEKLKVLSEEIYKIAVGTVSSEDTGGKSEDGRGESKGGEEHDHTPATNSEAERRRSGGSGSYGNSVHVTREEQAVETQKLEENLQKGTISEITEMKVSVETDYKVLEDNIQKNIGKSVFKFFEKAKILLNSKLLLLLGAAHLEKNGFLTIELPNNKKHCAALFTAFFLRLEVLEHAELKVLMESGPTLAQELFTIFVERDSKIMESEEASDSGGKKPKYISIYALLYLFNLDWELTVVTNKPLKPQLFANKPIFGKTKGDSSRLNEKNINIIITILRNIALKLGQINAVYDIYVKNEQQTAKDFQNLRNKYHDVISKNKSVIAMLKRRDDWNSIRTTDATKLHYRFKMIQEGNARVSDDSHNRAIKLSYNDTPLRLPYNEAGININSLNMSYSHEYKLYGFDSIFSAKENNSSIADKFNKDYLEYMKTNASIAAGENETAVLEPLCFIGYGQSGSGKTSTLIYLDIFNEDGILIEIIKKLNPEKVTCSMIEIYEDQSATKSDESCLGIGTILNKKEGGIIKCYDGGVGKPRKPIDLPEPVDKHTESGVIPALRFVEIGEILDKRADDENYERVQIGHQKQSRLDGHLQGVSKKTMKGGTGEGTGGGEQKANADGAPAGHSDSDRKVTFERSGTAWLYTHNPSGKEGIDLNYDVKQYIMDAFECREIGPTSNNKQSSRSHVVVCLRLEGIDVNGVIMTQTIFVCDLAGVENVFDCTPGSEDSIRMMAKILANEDYHLNTVKAQEEWGEPLTRKRPRNMLKYVHESIHIGANKAEEDAYEKDPNCWPDGSPNPKGDLDAIAAEYSRKFISDWYKSLIGDSVWGEHTPKKAFDYYKAKLSVLPVVDTSIDKVEAGINAFFEAATQEMPGFRGNTTISDFFYKGGDYIYGDINRTITTGSFNKLNGSGINSQKVDSALDKLLPFPTLHTVTVVDSAMKNYNKDTLNVINGVLNRGEQQANWSNPVIGKREVSLSTFGTSETNSGEPAYFSQKWVAANPDEIFGVIKKFLQKAFNIFNVLVAPDCVLAYVGGIKSACEIRRQEGYVINNTLKQLIIDLGIVMKESIKEKLEKGGKKPCIFADMYDEYSEYWVLDPLMDWYDIRNAYEKEKDFGSILTAMCILGGEGGEYPDIDKSNKLEFLKKFKFVMTTVVNESFMMNFNNKPGTTPAGNLIYVNNPPLPPFINVSILELALRTYQFYKYDNRDADDDAECGSGGGGGESKKMCDTPDEEDRRINAVTGYFNAYLNLIIKLFTHPLYQEEAIKQLNLFKVFQKSEGGKKVYPLIQFADRKKKDRNQEEGGQENDDNQALYNAWHYFIKESPRELRELETQCGLLIAKIKSNNAATYLGTMQTTEEVNRVSSKIMLSKAVNSESVLKVKEKNNLNNKILQALFNILTWEGELPSPLYNQPSFEKQKIDGQLYECLYRIAMFDALEKPVPHPKRTLTLKEKEIESMLVAVEAIFPKAISYIDYAKLQHLWEQATMNEEKTGRILFVTKREGVEMGNGYPYLRDKMKKNNAGEADLVEIFKANNKDKTGVLSKTDVHDILTLNAKIKEFGALEPSPSFMGKKEIDAINKLSSGDGNVLDWQGKGVGKMSMSGGQRKPNIMIFAKKIGSSGKCYCGVKKGRGTLKGFPSTDWKIIWGDKKNKKANNKVLYKKCASVVETHVANGGCRNWDEAMKRWEKAKAEKDAASAAEAKEAERYAKEGAQLDLDWYRQNSKVTSPAMSILKHILRDDFIDEYNKQYLIAQLSKTGPPERSGNGWTDEYYEPKPAVFKIKEFPGLFEDEMVKNKENQDKFKPQSISTLNKNHVFYFTDFTEKLNKKYDQIDGWARGGGQKGGNKRKSRRKTKRKSRKKKKSRRKRNTKKI